MTDTPQPAWLLCPDCTSQVHEVWADRTLRIEVAHSDSCPAWRDDGREVAIELAPKSTTNDEETAR